MTKVTFNKKLTRAAALTASSATTGEGADAVLTNEGKIYFASDGAIILDGRVIAEINPTEYDPSQLSGAVPVNKGGTGATDAGTARTNLGLGTAATHAEGDFATAAQGAAAESAVQTVAEGSANGTIKVDGTDVSVHGLGSAAYAGTDAFDAAGAAEAVLGDSETDDETDATVYGAIALANTKVTSVTAGDNSITIGGTATEPTVAAKISSAQGNALSINTSTGTEGLYVAAAAEYTIEEAQTVTNGYAKTYILKKGGVEVSGSKIDIPKDMVLDTAQIVEYNGTDTTVTIDEVSYDVPENTDAGKYLVMIMKNKAKTQIWLDLASLIDVYTAADRTDTLGAIDVTNNKIGVKVDAATTNTVDAKTTNKNFLKINSDNELVVKGVDADSAFSTSTIEVNGGPLADDADDSSWPWMENNKKVIPAGKSVQEILKGLFLKVNNGTLGEPDYTWSPVLGKPTVKIGGKTSGIVEVGSTQAITFAENTTVTGNTHSVSVSASGSGKYGYYLDDAETRTSTTNYTQDVTGSVDGTNVVTCTFTGGNPSESNAAVAASGTTKVMKVGNNSATASQSGLTASVGDLTAHTLYASTNTGAKVAGTSESVTANHQNDKALTSTATATVTGCWPVYSNKGGITGALTKETLDDTDTFEITFADAEDPDTNKYDAFAFPSTHTLAAVWLWNPTANKYEQQTLNTATQVSDYSATITINSVGYNVYKHIAPNGWGTNSLVKFVLNKKTSVA